MSQHEAPDHRRRLSSATGIVQVLLSTFEPSEFLRETLNSVRAQDYPDITLLVRDDGSQGGAVRLAASDLSGLASAEFLVGEHLGAGASFLALLSLTDPRASYAAFCDQDDVWLPGKLSAAVQALQRLEGPALYCSAVQLVDPDLSPIKVHRRCVRGPSFENALVENIATGCTIVLNRAGVDLVASRTPNAFVMHDAWCYLVVAGCGTVVYDPRPQVLYRVHGTNTVGVGTTLWSEWVGRVRRQVRLGHLHTLRRQAEELRRLYRHDLRPSALESLDEFLGAQSSLARRLAYAFHGSTYFQRRVDNLAYRFLYAAGRI